jgi:glutamine synthetase
MESLRFKALENITTIQPELIAGGTAKITGIFGENVFTLDKAREYLSDEAYKSLKASINSGKRIDRNMGNQIGSGLRAWAESKGVTHFTMEPL